VDPYFVGGQIVGLSLRLSVEEWQTALNNPELSPTNRKLLEAVVALRVAIDKVEKEETR